MKNTSRFRIFQENKSLIENVQNAIHSFDIDKMKEYAEYKPFELIENAFDTGNKILKNFPNIGEENRNCFLKVINKDIFDDIKALDIDRHLDKIKPCIEEFKSYYDFSVLSEEDYAEFSEQLILFSLMYSFNRDLILISRHRTNILKSEDSQYKYVKETLNPRIHNFNNTGKILFKNFDVIHPIPINEADETINIDCPFYFSTKKYKTSLLKAVNEFSYRYSYSISSFIDISKRCVNITSDKVFNLIWHIFVNFILADVLPDKITFCDDCYCMIENNTKIRKLCEKCEDKAKNRKKSKNKK